MVDLVRELHALAFSHTLTAEGSPVDPPEREPCGTGGHFFDTGRVRAQIRAADARGAAGLARYEQTVLQALEETETALSRLRREKERVERLEASVGSNRGAVHLAELRYGGGLEPLLPVLDAERALFESETELVTSETALGTDVVVLYKALGGGWEHTGS